MKKEEREVLVNELKSLKIVNENEVLYNEYVDDMLEFQTTLSKIVFDGDSSARFDDIVYRIKEQSRMKELGYDFQISNTIKGLQSIGKELAISFSGKKGEDRIARKIDTCLRKDILSFNNVTVSDDIDHTEIDNIILTKRGLIVLEVKNAKCPITISNNGRLLYNNETSYHDVSIGEKMSKKRKLLRYCLENKLKELNTDVPIFLDSYIVFSSPGKKNINITDNFGKEKYCSKDQLPFVINDFKTEVIYSDNEYDLLSKVLGDLRVNSKKFIVTINFNKICNDFLKTMELLDEGDVTEKEVEVENRGKQKNHFDWMGEIAPQFIGALVTIGTFAITTAISRKWPS